MANSRYNPEQIALSRKERFFIAKETNYGVIAEPVNTDLARLVGTASFKQAPEFRDNKETRDTRSQLQKIKGRLPHGTFTLPTYIKPSGTPGTAPVPDALLQGVFGTKTTRAADAVELGSGTVNSFIPATIANFKANQAVAVLIGAGVEVRRITSVDASVHVAPDFSEAPADGAAIYAAVGYTLADELSSYSIWRDLGHTAICYPGCVVDKLGVAFNGQDELVGNFGGGYQREVRCGTDKLAEDVAGAGTLVITVEDGKKFDIGARFNISDGVNAETKCVVTGKDGNDLTVTRGTGARAWTAADGVDVYPWVPAGTDAGHIIHSRRGACALNGVATSVLSFSIDLDNKVKFYEDEKTSSGNDYCESYSTPGEREVRQRLELYFRQKHLSIFADVDTVSAQELWAPAYAMDAAGKAVPGRIAVVLTPQSLFRMPDMSDKDGDRVLAVDCEPYGSNTGNDELAMWFM